MKDVTRAYEDGDLARLLHLERHWNAGETVKNEDDEAERRCAVLARLNQALRAQLADLAIELRELKRSPPFEMLRDIGHMTGTGAKDGVPTLMAGVADDLVRLRDLRDFVGSYRAGKNSLEVFLEGPAWLEELEDDDIDDLDLDGLLDGLMDAVAAQTEAAGPRPKRRKSRQRKAR